MLCSCVMQLELKTHISPLLTTESPVAQWLEHPTRSRRVVGSRIPSGARIFPSSQWLLSTKIHLIRLYHSHIRSLGWLVGSILDMLQGDCAMQLWAMLSVVIWLCSCVMQLESKTHISPLLTMVSPVAQWLEHPTRSPRVVGSNPIWSSDFFRVPSGFLSTLHLICVKKYVWLFQSC